MEAPGRPRRPHLIHDLKHISVFLEKLSWTHFSNACFLVARFIVSAFFLLKVAAALRLLHRPMKKSRARLEGKKLMLILLINKPEIGCVQARPPTKSNQTFYSQIS
jgi:hypothetical protein